MQGPMPSPACAEGKEGPWKNVEKRMKNKEESEEPWKRGKAKPEQREREMVNEVEEETPSKTNKLKS